MKRNDKIMALCFALIAMGAGVTSIAEHKELQEVKGKAHALEEQLDKSYSNNEKLINANKDMFNQLSKMKTDYESVKKQMEEMFKSVNFSPCDVTQKSGATEFHIKKALKDSKELSSLSQYFIEAENKYGVNAFFLIGIAAHESMWGKHDRANYQNNLTGFMVYEESAEGGYFDSQGQCILETGKLLRNDYLNSDGTYHVGLSVHDINTHYCLGADKEPDYNWEKDVVEIATTLCERANN